MPSGLDGALGCAAGRGAARPLSSPDSLLSRARSAASSSRSPGSEPMAYALALRPKRSKNSSAKSNNPSSPCPDRRRKACGRRARAGGLVGDMFRWRLMEEITAARKIQRRLDFLRMIADRGRRCSPHQRKRVDPLALHRIVAVVYCASTGSAASPDASRSLEMRARACQIGQTRADLGSFAAAEPGESWLTYHRHRPAPFTQERGAGRYQAMTV